MCGIIGYVGSGDETADILMSGLFNLEYRGYDSAGIALIEPSLTMYKKAGEVTELERSLPSDTVRGAVGIGHTRWSTHGAPSDANAHPHTDCNGDVAVVHNGIIENYQELRAELADSGHEFESETDTEVVPHLIESFLETGANPEHAFRLAIDRIDGSYAIAAVFEDTEAVYAVRKHSPLVLGLGEDGNYLASDVPAFIAHTDRVIYLEDGEFVRLTEDEVVVTNTTGDVLEKTVDTIDWDPQDAGKSGYGHYMLKEINEQPQAIRQCLQGRTSEHQQSVLLEELADLDHDGLVQLVACGTSYHAAMYGEQLLQERGMQAQSFFASEYDADRIAVDNETLVIGVTQSGETADTLSALREANRAGAATLAVTNVVGSSAARECEYVVYIRAGPEISVAATKSFVSQQITLALIASTLADVSLPRFLRALQRLPDHIQRVLDRTTTPAVASEIADSEAYFFIGRGTHVPVALEGALKMKEITYKHAEGFPSGELKHGPLALLTPNTPVIALVTNGGETATKTIGNVNEVAARDAPVIAVTDARESVEGVSDTVLEVPRTHPWLAPVLANVQLQLLSYWVATRLGRPIDKPRHLAKTVTVE
ncbi:glutamine--fructose-6-phosphate transaminase (isomerizing) [Salinadaptatus halalkaliphilus]|uniref:Glutamine--fructose-6-phosphate aminotransferase [isomerizing] n=1 Tax=Salinadaptatus halalkaliphilus TaxID=2419781 RepID=A0A4S3TK13_9EURY|nr:glutamine--fructose-6-phosphate transaminase (isomerizing) [Salinadaptatus halalkaliphilus]THE64449.1 glutamine--fructose-6-phosphate transaminase (isomerizing) [Salinadaptatus halalkaliphilus]